MLLSSCYTISHIPITDEMNNCIGKTEQQIILEKGSPARITEDGAGGKVLRYEYTTYQSISYPAYYNSGSLMPATTATQANTQYMEFFINTSNTVYNWRTNYYKTIKKEDKGANKAIRTTSGIAMVIIVGTILISH